MVQDNSHVTGARIVEDAQPLHPAKDGWRRRKLYKVDVSVPDEFARDADRSGQNTPSSDSTQMASEELTEFDLRGDEGHEHTTTLTLKVTGDPGKLLQAIAAFSDVVVLQSTQSTEPCLSSPIILTSDRDLNCEPALGHQRAQPESTQGSYFNTSMSELVWGRTTVLILLLVLQSASSVVLSSYQQLIERNVFLALFLTMLTGTGGNAGNQSSALVIRGLSTGEITSTNMLSVLVRETLASSVIGFVLAAAAFARVVVTDGCDTVAAFIVSSSTLVTVVFSIVGGTAVPMVLNRLGLDPCNLSSPILATITDVMGVLLLCMVTTALVGHV